jgi:hypothetical protein
LEKLTHNLGYPVIMKKIVLKTDSSGFDEFMDRLFTALSHTSHKVGKIAFKCFNIFPELISFKSNVTSVATIALLLKPLQIPLDLSIAIRTGNFEHLVVEQSHGFSFFVNSLLELDILSAYKRPPNRTMCNKAIEEY